MSNDTSDPELYLHPISHKFSVGDAVVDLTAKREGWSDINGKVIEVDGSQVKVRYKSGNVRWKKHINLQQA
jgi:hypothetical protein